MLILKNKMKCFSLPSSSLGKFLLILAFFLLPTFSYANVSSFTKQINYQGKLTDSTGATVADGSYNMQFKLYNTLTSGSAVWTNTLIQNDRVAVAGGLFSVLLGATSTTLTSVDFNQPLYLSINIGGTTNTVSPTFDGEMTPRKTLGTVPHAFDSDVLDGLDSTAFVRTDATSTVATSSSQTLLTLNQLGAGGLLSVQSNSVSMLTVLNSGNLGIGTTSPWGQLSINPNGITGPAFAIGSSTATNFVVTNGGRVGIATSTPTAQLEVNGDIRFGTMKGSLSSSGNDIYIDAMTSGATYFRRNTLTSSATSMTVDTSGNVGIGTTTPWRTLSVVGTMAVNGLSSATGDSLCINATTKEIVTNTGATTCAVSSRRYKHDIKPLGSWLDSLRAFKPVSYINNSNNQENVGLIAEDVSAIDSRLVIYDQDGKPNGVKYENLTAILLKGIQELASTTDKMALDIEALQAAVASTTQSLSIGGNNVQAVVDYLASLGVKIEQGIAYFKEIVADKFTANILYVRKGLQVGDETTPTAITVFDKLGKAGCLTVDDVLLGAVRISQGKCGEGVATSAQTSIVSTSSSTPALDSVANSTSQSTPAAILPTTQSTELATSTTSVATTTSEITAGSISTTTETSITTIP